MSTKEVLIQEIEQMPEEEPILKVILDLIEVSKAKPMSDAFDFSWEGALEELKDKYTSVELQHKVREWR